MDVEQSPGLDDYIGALRRRRSLVLAIAAPIAAAGIAIALGLPSVYLSEGEFEIEQAKVESYMPAMPNDNRAVRQLDQYVASLSDDVLAGFRLREFVAAAKPFPALADDPGAAAAVLRKGIKVRMVKQKILDAGTSREREIISGFAVGFRHEDPATTQLVAKWLTESFTKANREQYRQRAQSAAAFLKAEAETFSTRITTFERKLADFKARNAEQLPGQSNVNMELRDRTDRDVDGAQLQIRTLQRERVFVAQQLEEAKSNPLADNVRELEAEYARRITQYDENHPDVVSLRLQIEAARSGGRVDGQSASAQLDAERRALAAARQRYSEDHPDIRRIQRRIESLEVQVARGGGGDGQIVRRTPIIVQLQTQLNAIDTQISGLQGQVFGLQGKSDEYARRVVTSPEVEREYQQITRDLETARQKYNDLLNKQMDAELSVAAITGGRGDEFRLVGAPVVPTTPVSPKRPAIVILALLGALLAGFVAAVVAESADPNVRSAFDVRRALQQTPLAVVPDIETIDSVALGRRRAAVFSTTVLAGAVVLFAAVRLLA